MFYCALILRSSAPLFARVLDSRFTSKLSTSNSAHVYSHACFRARTAPCFLLRKDVSPFVILGWDNLVPGLFFLGLCFSHQPLGSACLPNLFIVELSNKNFFPWFSQIFCTLYLGFVDLCNFFVQGRVQGSDNQGLFFCI